WAAVDGAIAENAADDAILFLELDRMRRARRDADVRGDDAIGAQHADGEVGDVHGAALAAAVAPFPAEQLAHHGERIGAFRQGVPVAAVSRKENVLARQVTADPSGDSLLANGRMNGAQHHLLFEASEGLLFECADAVHQAMMRTQPLNIDVAT